MRWALTFATFAFLVSQPLPALAEDIVTCDDLTEIANALDEVSAAVAEAGKIREGSDDDKTLRELIDALLTIAESENEPKLTESVKKLDAAWEKMDWKAFVKHLEDVTAAFDKLYRRDCK